MHDRISCIFDVDGVLIDSVAINWQAINQALKPHRVRVDDGEIARYLGKTLEDQVAQLNEDFRLSLDYAEFAPIVEKIKSTLYDSLSLKEGVKELLESFHAASIRMGVATSMPRGLTEKRLKNMGILEYFSHLVTSDDVGAPKPDPEVYTKAANLLKADPSVCVVLEDAPAGVQAAKAAGMRCIAVLSPYVSRSALSNADLIVSSLKEINLANIRPLTQPV